MPSHPFIAPFAVLAIVTACLVLAGALLRTVAARHRPLAFHVLAVWALVVLVANGANSLGLAPSAVAGAAAAGIVALLAAFGALSPRQFTHAAASQGRDAVWVGLVLAAQVGLYLLPLLLIYPAQTLVTGNFICNDSVHHAVMMLGQDVGETTFPHWPYTTFYPRGIHAVTFGLQALFPIDEAPHFLLPVSIWASSFLGLSILMLLSVEGERRRLTNLIVAASPAGAFLLGTSVYLFFLGHMGVLPFLVGAAVLVASGAVAEVRGRDAVLYLLPAAASLATYQLFAATLIVFAIGSRLALESWRAGAIREPMARLLSSRPSAGALAGACVVGVLCLPVLYDIARGYEFFAGQSSTVGNLPGGYLLPFHVTGAWKGGAEYRSALTGPDSPAVLVLAVVLALQVWLVARARLTAATSVVLWTFAVPTLATAMLGMSQYINFKYLCLLTAVWVPLWYLGLRRGLASYLPLPWLQAVIMVATLLAMVGSSIRSYATLPALPERWFAALEQIRDDRLSDEAVLVLSREDWFQYYSDANDVVPMTTYLRKPYTGQPIQRVLIDEAFLKDAVTLLDAAFPGASSRLDEPCRGDTRDGRFRLYDAACLNP